MLGHWVKIVFETNGLLIPVFQFVPASSPKQRGHSKQEHNEGKPGHFCCHGSSFLDLHGVYVMEPWSHCDGLMTVDLTEDKFLSPFPKVIFSEVFPRREKNSTNDVKEQRDLAWRKSSKWKPIINTLLQKWNWCNMSQIKYIHNIRDKILA